MSLPKSFCLKKGRDFESVKEKGRLFSSSSFSLLVLKDQRLPNSLFGFIISKKVSRKAVVRNRIRRRIAAILSLMRRRIKPGYKIVFLVKSGVLDQSFPRLTKEVEEVLRESQILKDA